MAQLEKIHNGKRPHRIHYIAEWAAKRNLRQKDVVAELNIDKGTVSRWFAGSLPTEGNLEALAALFHTEVNSLFRHPDEDWVARLFRNHNEAQREKDLKTLRDLFDLMNRNRTGTEN